MPNADKVSGSVLKWYRSGQDVDNVFFIRNFVELLDEIERQTGKGLSSEELRLMIDFSTRQLGNLKCSDGGFVSFRKQTHIRPNDMFGNTYPVDRQGDLNAAASARAFRNSFYRLSHVPDKKNLELPADFWKDIGKY